MLVLTDANGLGFNLHQFCQRVLQPPRDADRAAQRHVQTWKLLRRQFRRRIHRRPCLADNHLGRFGPRQGGQHICHQLFAFPRRRAIADRNQIHLMRPDQAGQFHLRATQIILWLERIDRAGRQHLTRCIHHRQLAPRADAGVHAQCHAPARRGRQQQVFQVARKDPDCLGLRRITQVAHQIQRQRRLDLDPPRPGRRLAQPDIARPLG